MTIRSISFQNYKWYSLYDHIEIKTIYRVGLETYPSFLYISDIRQHNNAVYLDVRELTTKAMINLLNKAKESSRMVDPSVRNLLTQVLVDIGVETNLPFKDNITTVESIHNTIFRCIYEQE